MNERINILKKLYPNYLILVKVKDKIKFVGIDKLIVDTFGIKKLKNVNKLLLDNLDIKILEEYDNNSYEDYYLKINEDYYLKIKVIEIIKEIKKGIKDEEKNINS